MTLEQPGLGSGRERGATCSAQARPLGRHKGPSLGAHELGPHSFTMPYEVKRH